MWTVSVGYDCWKWKVDTAIAGLFPEEQQSLNITKEEIRNTMISNVRKARDYLCEKNPAIVEDKLNVKFSVIIEKPTKEDRLPMTILISPMAKPHSPPIVCDVYHVVRQNAVVKDSKWVVYAYPLCSHN